MTRIFFSAGESSGDVHGSNLIRALRALEPEVACEGVGGRQMAKAGMELRHDLASQAVMGFGEVVRSFRSIRRVFLDTAAHVARSRPDALVVIDYPGFNIRLAKRAKAAGVPVVYYIGPQVWAWKKGRIHAIAHAVDKMLVILPFEEALYRQVGVDCTYVGHPLLDHVARTELTGEFEGEPVIAVLPGSRKQEIARLMDAMMDVAKGIRQAHPGARFVVPCVDTVRERQVREAAGDVPLETIVARTYDVLAAARFALVASGTATLETALFGVPMLILYKTSPLNYAIARWLVHITRIGLVNILAGRDVVPEFIQGDACADKVLPVALELIRDTPRRARMLTDLAEVRAGLGAPGASARAAQAIVDVAKGAAHA